MSKACSFCSDAAHLRVCGLRLCPACQAQLIRLQPHSAAYLWYVSAIRRALFPGENSDPFVRNRT